MSYASQNSAIRSRFNTLWGSTTPVSYPNDEYKPVVGTSWVKLTIAGAEAYPASFGDPGNNVFRHPGMIIISIYCPTDEGDKLALELADQACAVFRNWQSGGITCHLAPYVRLVESDDTAWYRLNVICPFRRDDFF